MAELIPSATAAANSADFSVGPGQQVAVFLKGAGEAQAITGQAIIQLKTVDGIYLDIVRIGERSPNPVRFTLTAPGTYRVRKPVTDQAVGVDYVGSGIAGAGSGLLVSSDLTQAAISFSASGDNTIVSATASQTTRVHRMYLTVQGPTAITVKNGAGASLTGAMPLGTFGGLMLDYSDRPWYKTSVNTALILNSSAAVQVSGIVEYVKDAQ